MIFTRFVVFCVVFIVLGSQAWLAPERCAQNTRSRRSSPIEEVKTASSRKNIQEVADTQNARLKRKYVNYKFMSVPISLSGSAREVAKFYFTNSLTNCSFYTHSPSLIASVDCQEGVSCTLARSVSTLDTYTASEGYNWGVKMSSKFSLFEKVFEIGGEVSTGGTYSCAYTKGKTVSDTVSCADSSGKGRLLQLYNVKSDMRCFFGNTKFESEERDGQTQVSAPDNHFTNEEKMALYKSSSSVIVAVIETFVLVDVDKISDQLLNKLTKAIPKYNPYTDLVGFIHSSDGTDTMFLHVFGVEKAPEIVHKSKLKVSYYKKVEFEPSYEKIIPFTDEHGNSVYQYACTTLQ